MKWYEVTSVPFQREDGKNPWNIIIRNSCCFQLFISKIETSLHLYVSIEDCVAQNFEIEMKHASYCVKEAYALEISNIVECRRIMNERNRASLNYNVIGTNKNQANSLLNFLCTIENGGFCIEIKNKHKVSRMLQVQLNKNRDIDVYSFISQIINNNIMFDFSIYSFSKSNDISEMIADRIISCINGLQKKSGINSPVIWINELSKIISEDEINSIIKIVDYVGGYGIGYNRDTLIPQNSDYKISYSIPEYYFGQNFNGDKKIGITAKELCQHVFIAGGSGSGKGNLLINLTMQIFRNNVSFLIIEAAKSELHNLAKWIPSLKIWRPEGGKFVLNPFSLPDGLNFEDYRNNLTSILHGFFDIDSPGAALPSLFEETLTKCSSKFINNPFNPSPFGIVEFITEYKNLDELKKYDKTIQDRLRTAGINRAKETMTNEFVLDSLYSIPTKELITGFNVLQLEALGTDEGKRKFAYVLLNQILAYLQKKRNDELNLVIIIDESHVLLKDSGEYPINEYFHKMIDEFRSRGISIILADQSANNIPEGLVNDSYTKIFMGANDKTGISNFVLKAKLDELSFDYLYTLKAGEGILISDNNSSGIAFKTENLIDKLDVYNDCNYQNLYLENNRVTIETYRECKSCIYKGKCTFQNKEEAKTYSEYFYNLNKALLCKYFTDRNKYAKELLKIIREVASNLNDITFGCYLKQVFRKYNMEYGNNEKDYDREIDAIIKYRKRKLR